MSGFYWNNKNKLWAQYGRTWLHLLTRQNRSSYTSLFPFGGRLWPTVCKGSVWYDDRVIVNSALTSSVALTPVKHRDTGHTSVARSQFCIKFWSESGGQRWACVVIITDLHVATSVCILFFVYFLRKVPNSKLHKHHSIVFCEVKQHEWTVWKKLYSLL